jgi:hypothetical protein
MKPSMTGCAVGLVTAPALIFAAHAYLPEELGEPRLWFAAASGVLLSSALSSLWLLLTNKTETRDDLLRRAQSGQPPSDGEAMLVTGRLRAAAPLLTAPLSGTTCVAYFYRMYRLGKALRGSSPRPQVPVYWGYASRPLAVETPSGPIAVAAPRLSVPWTSHSGSEAAERARSYLRRVTAEVCKPQSVVARDSLTQWPTDTPLDEDGGARRDWKSGDDADPASLLLEEWVLTPEAEVSVHGRWSARRNALAGGGRPGDVGPTVAMGPLSALGLAAPPSRSAHWA